MKTRIKFKHIIFLFLVLLTLFSYFSCFITRNATPPHWDYAGNLLNSLDYLEIIQQKDYLSIFTYYRFYYPPLVYWVMGLFFWSFGYRPQLILVFNFVLLTTTVICFYFLLVNLLKNKLSALNGSLLLIVFLLLGHTNNFKTMIWELMLDFPYFCFVLLAYFSLFFVFRKKRLFWTTIFSIASSCAMLTKWTAIIYLVIPTILFVWYCLKEHNSKSFIVWMFLTPLMVAPWYIYHFKQLWPQLSYYSSVLGLERQDAQGVNSLFNYLRILIRLPPQLYILGIFTVILCLLNLKSMPRLSRLQIIFSLSLTGLPIFFLSFVFSNKDERYVFPLFVSLYLLIFLKISEVLDKHKFYNLTLFMIILITIASNLPKPDRNQYLYNLWFKQLEQKTLPEVAYYFEDDNVKFNYNNVELKHRIMKLKGINIESSLLNSYSERSRINTCEVDIKKPTFIAVYKSNHTDETNINPEDPVNQGFELNCAQTISAYVLFSEVKTDKERLKVYKLTDG